MKPDDKTHHLSDLQGENGFVTAFIFNHCPYAESIILRFVRETSSTSMDAYPLKATTINEAFLVKLFATDKNHIPALQNDLSQQLEQHQARLDDHLQTEQNFFSANKMSTEQKMLYLTLKRGISYERHCIDWATDAMAILDETQSNPIS